VEQLDSDSSRFCCVLWPHETMVLNSRLQELEGKTKDIRNYTPVHEGTTVKTRPWLRIGTLPNSWNGTAVGENGRHVLLYRSADVLSWGSEYTAAVVCIFKLIPKRETVNNSNYDRPCMIRMSPTDYG